MIKEIFKYLDLFGTEFTFYSDGKKKRYSLLGGILSITTIVFYLIGTIYLNLEYFKQNKPIIIKSELPDNKKNKIIKKSNKIWIPWRIIGKNNNYINFSELISLKINRYSNNESNIDEYLNVNNKLCSEIPIKMKGEDTNIINVPLDLLYCTEIDLNSFNDSYMIVDISLFCNNFSENNQNCDSREEIFKNIMNNELKIEIFFPLIKYRPINKKIPFYIEYKKYIYYFSENTYKIDYLFLKEYIFNDDSGLVIQNIKNMSYWGCNLLNSGYYYTKEKKNLYSLNIYLDRNVIYYQRSYKKLYNILSDSFPLFFVLFFIFEKFSYIFKLIEDKKVLFELLFENSAEKPGKIVEFKSKISPKKSQIDENRSISHNNILLDKNSNNYSINNVNEGNVNNICIILNKNNIQKEINNKIITPLNKMKNHSLFKDNIPISPINIFSQTPKPGIYFKYNSCSKFHLKIKKQNIKMIKYKRTILFPYKYYLLSIFCKNMMKISIEKIKYNKNYKKFLNINVYIGKFLDITTYVYLHKEFRVLKEKIFNKKNINLLGDDQKININDQFSMYSILKNAGSKNESSIL